MKLFYPLTHPQQPCNKVSREAPYSKQEEHNMKLIALTSAAIVAFSTTAFAETADRPETWQFHDQYRNCAPDNWTQSNGGYWSNNTCESLTNSSKESRRDRARAIRAANEAQEAAAAIEAL